MSVGKFIDLAGTKIVVNPNFTATMPGWRSEPQIAVVGHIITPMLHRVIDLTGKEIVLFLGPVVVEQFYPLTVREGVSVRGLIQRYLRPMDIRPGRRLHAGN